MIYGGLVETTFEGEESNRQPDRPDLHIQSAPVHALHFRSLVCRSFNPVAD